MKTIETTIDTTTTITTAQQSLAITHEPSPIGCVYTTRVGLTCARQVLRLHLVRGWLLGPPQRQRLPEQFPCKASVSGSSLLAKGWFVRLLTLPVQVGVCHRPKKHTSKAIKLLHLRSLFVDPIRDTCLSPQKSVLVPV
eukprot:g23907.t1